MTGKVQTLSKHPHAFSKYSEALRCWIILKPVGTGSFAHIGQGATPAQAWKDASA